MTEIWRGKVEIDEQLLEMRIARLSPKEVVVQYPDGWDGTDTDADAARVLQVPPTVFKHDTLGPSLSASSRVDPSTRRKDETRKIQPTV